MTIDEMIEILKPYKNWMFGDQKYGEVSVKDIIEALSAQPDTDKWIPIEWHEITDEEREEDVYPEEWETLFDCEMPCDGEEILVQTKHGYINKDMCYEDDGLKLDSGCDWIEDIVAWRSLPEPYEGGE